jgi:hypothetical protein
MGGNPPVDPREPRFNERRYQARQRKKRAASSLAGREPRRNAPRREARILQWEHDRCQSPGFCPHRRCATAMVFRGRRA